MNKSITNTAIEKKKMGEGEREQIPFSPLPLFPLSLVLLLALVLLAPVARAALSEPDNLLYGTIVLDNQTVTAARADVVIEARRTLGGSPIASYRMGSNPQIGSFYALRLDLESAPPVTNTNASQVGDAVYIVVRDASGVRGQTTFTFPERGHVQRVDFGTPVMDADGNGLPDAWEIAHFGGTGQNPNAINLNGQTTIGNFIAGSIPNDTNTLFKVSLMTSGNQQFVSFLARRAEGLGYEGRTRYYMLECTTNLGSGLWIGVNGFTNVPGNNQTVTYPSAATNSPAFYRGQVRLQGL